MLPRFIRSASPLSAALVIAIIAVALIGWGIGSTVRRVLDASENLIASQRALASGDAILEWMTNAQDAVRATLVSGTPSFGTLQQSESQVSGALDDLAAFTSDNPNQTERVRQLRAEAARAFEGWRALVAARQSGAPLEGAALDTLQTLLDPARTLLRQVRLDAQVELARRASTDRAAVSSIRRISVAAILLAMVLIGGMLWLVSRDVGHQRRTAEELRTAKEALEQEVDARTRDIGDMNERLRSIIESAVDGIIVIDSRGRIELCNRAAERLFGYTAAEVMGQNVTILMPSPYREEHDGYLARYYQTRVPHIIGIGREVTGRRRDGSTFPLHLSVGEMFVRGERKFTGILHDLSERARIEGQLREQAALVRLGEMAAVIAHEVKNPLAGVRGVIQVIAGRLPQDSRDAAMMQEIISRIDALNELMKDLLLFARPPQPRPVPVELPALIASTAALLAEDPALRDVRVAIQGTAPPVVVDPDLLKIVVSNILVNAAHAMDGRGVVQVALGVSGSTCTATFSDTGPGIPAEERDRIFEPFFTTKARGTGLGLPTAKRLIEAQRGTIGIECPETGGARVTLELPLQPPPA